MYALITPVVSQRKGGKPQVIASLQITIRRCMRVVVRGQVVGKHRSQHILSVTHTGIVTQIRRVPFMILFPKTPWKKAVMVHFPKFSVLSQPNISFGCADPVAYGRHTTAAVVTIPVWLSVYRPSDCRVTFEQNHPHRDLSNFLLHIHKNAIHPLCNRPMPSIKLADGIPSITLCTVAVEKPASG